MKYSLAQISEIVGGQLYGSARTQVLEDIVFDSRKILSPSNALFMAIPTDVNDGHKYITHAYKEGIRSFLISEKLAFDHFQDAQFLLVEDTVGALKSLALYHRQLHNITSIGITGSNGKTTIKEWLSILIDEDFALVKSPQSFNSQLGVAISVLQIEDHHNFGIFEAGISKKKEMVELSKMINCSIGIFSNIGDAHNAGFLNNLEKIREKAHLFSHADKIIYCSDHQDISSILEEEFSSDRRIAWSNTDHCARYLVQCVTHSLDNTEITISRNSELLFIYSAPFGNESMLENITHCLICTIELGLSPIQIQDRLTRIKSVPLRLEMKQGYDQNIIINDSYSADIHSFVSALEFMNSQGGDLARVLIITDFLDNTTNHQDLYKTIGQLINKYGFKSVFALGSDIQLLQEIVQPETSLKIFVTKQELKSHITQQSLQHSVVLIKGARNYHLEDIADLLSYTNHSTELIINLNAIAHNIKIFKNRLLPTTEIYAVIKASAYGAGSINLAKFLSTQGIYGFAVAHVDEGVELRKAGITKPIIILNPEISGFSKLYSYHLSPEISSIGMLNELIRLSKSEEKFIPIHVKLDTGLHRLGFSSEDLPKLAELINIHDIPIASIFSHLAASNDASKDAFTMMQFAKFDEMYAHLSQLIQKQPKRHILNSAGIIRFPQYQYEAVRLGLGLYGIERIAGLTIDPEKAHRLIAVIATIKTVPKGGTISYGVNFFVDEEKRIGIVNIGYADGVNRLLGHGKGEFVVRQHKVKTIGSICMDMLILDLTDFDDIIEGDVVEIFGSNNPIEKLAEQCGTIPYELLCNISPRLKRVLIQQ